ncbi:MAG: nuclear transport factor 2 family protein [Candidatus Limnocylindrales bacterium]
MSDRPMAAEIRAIEESVTDYFESWFDGDVERMRRCLHPRLAKRRPPKDGSEETDLQESSHAEMIASVSEGPKSGFDRRIAIKVLDVAGDIATVKVLSAPFDEYLHLARLGERWLIVNALYRWRPDPGSPID